MSDAGKKRLQPRQVDMTAVRTYLVTLSPLLVTLLAMGIWMALISTLVLCPELLEVCEPYSKIGDFVRAMDGEVSDAIASPNLGTYAERMKWSLSVGICILGTLLTLGVIIHVMLSTASLSRSWRRAAFVGSGLTVLLVALGAINMLPMEMLGHPKLPASMFFHASLYREFQAAQDITVALDKLGLLISLLLAITAAWLLVPRIRHRQRWEAELPSRAGKLHLILYCGAILLVAHTLRAATLFSWSLAYLVVEPGGASALVLADLERFVAVAVVARGTSYTIFLAAIYVPAAVVIGRHVPPVDSSGNSGDAWTGLLVGKTTRFLAVLAPLLSGPIADLLGAFSAV